MEPTAHMSWRGERARVDETSDAQTTARWVTEPDRSYNACGCGGC